MRRYCRLVASIARRLGLQPGDADDVQQQVWLAAVVRFTEPPEPEVLARFVAGTAVNSTRKLWRTRSRRPDGGSCGDLDAQAARPQPEPASIVHDELRRQALRECIEALPPPWRARFRVLVEDDTPRSYDERAVELGAPRGSLGPWRKRLLRMIRDCMERKGFDA